MKTLQIRLPDEVIKKVDVLIKEGLFKSRSHLLREAVSKFISEYNYIGVLPYIVGPFTPEVIEQLKEDPKKSLAIPVSKLAEIKKEFLDIIG